MYAIRSYYATDFVGYDADDEKWILKEGVADATSVVGDLAPGMMKLKNISGDDNIVNQEDQTFIGNANPLHTGGFTVSGRFHGFDASAVFNWSYGNSYNFV